MLALTIRLLMDKWNKTKTIPNQQCPERTGIAPFQRLVSYLPENSIPSLHSVA